MVPTLSFRSFTVAIACVFRTNSFQALQSRQRGNHPRANRLSSNTCTSAPPTATYLWACAKREADPVRIQNPLTSRSITVHGSVYYDVLRKGFVNHNGNFRRVGEGCGPYDPEPLVTDSITPNVIRHDRQAGIVFCSKPSGLLTAPGKEEPDSLVSRIRKQKIFRNAKPCHRLDRDTSGIVALGLDTPTKKATGSVAKQFQDRTTKKVYVALVAGCIAEDYGIINASVGKGPKTEEGWRPWVIGGDDSREAVTEWQVVERRDDHTKVRVVPKTGRGHQIRLHMASVGHPILGDWLHAPKNIAEMAPRLCLHAEVLELDLNGLREVIVDPAPF